VAYWAQVRTGFSEAFDDPQTLVIGASVTNKVDRLRRRNSSLPWRTDATPCIEQVVDLQRSQEFGDLAVSLSFRGPVLSTRLERFAAGRMHESQVDELLRTLDVPGAPGASGLAHVNRFRVAVLVGRGAGLNRTDVIFLDVLDRLGTVSAVVWPSRLGSPPGR
jgi:hypothetical protein